MKIRDIIGKRIISAQMQTMRFEDAESARARVRIFFDDSTHLDLVALEHPDGADPYVVGHIRDTGAELKASKTGGGR